MGCASSKEWEKQAKREGWKAPMSRSQSMPLQWTQKSEVLEKQDDNFHVVALTSSTYGILKVDEPKQDENAVARSVADLDEVSKMYHKMKNLDIPVMMEPKPWSEMSFNLPQLNLQLQVKPPTPDAAELETINMWELMEGLDDDTLSPFRGSAASPYGSRQTGSPVQLRPAGSPLAAKQLDREKSKSMFAVRTVEELDAALSENVQEGGSAKGKSVPESTVKLGKSSSFGVSGKENTRPTSLSSLMAQKSVSNSPVSSPSTVPSAISSSDSLKDSVQSSLVPSAGGGDVVKKPVKLSVGESEKGTAISPTPSPMDVAPSVSMSSPRKSSGNTAVSTAVRPAALPSFNSKQKLNTPVPIPPLVLDSSFQHVIVPKATAAAGVDKKASSRSVSPKVAGQIPPLSLDASYEHVSLPSPVFGGGREVQQVKQVQQVPQVQTAIKVSPNIAERMAAFTKVAEKTSPPAARIADKRLSGKPVSPFNNVQGAKTHARTLSDDSRPVTVNYVNNFPPSPDESEDLNSPLFDPDLLASFEKAFEQISEDDWYAVRSGDVETTTSGSTTDVESPVRRGRDSMPVAEMAAKGNKILQLPVESVQTPSRVGNVGAEVKNVKKLASSKVSPLVTVKQVKMVKADPLDKFERKCPPGGEGRVVFYSTSLRGIRKTFEDCNHLRMILESFSVLIDERDVSMHSEFRQELKDLMGKPAPVPRVFIKGRYIGGEQEVMQLHEDGVLAELVEGLPTEKSRTPCDGCGGVRFVPCLECSGSCKVLSDDDVIVRCPDCNENGLIRCPICF